MISKTQQTEVTFHAIEATDILALTPVMDKLVKEINEYHKYLKENDDKPNDYWVKEYNKEFPQMIEQYKILSTLGFISTILLNPEISLS